MHRPPNTPPRPAHPRAAVHPAACRFCGGHDFWELQRGLAHSDSVDRDGKRWFAWDFEYAVRCTKCHATFNATSPANEKDGDKLEWHLGRQR